MKALTEKQIRYRKYLQSEQWRNIRALVIRRCNGVCEGCGVRPVKEVHHKTYENIFNEFLFDLYGLCEHCHERIHRIGRHIDDRYIGRSNRLTRCFIEEKKCDRIEIKIGKYLDEARSSKGVEGVSPWVSSDGNVYVFFTDLWQWLGTKVLGRHELRACLRRDRLKTGMFSTDYGPRRCYAFGEDEQNRLIGLYRNSIPKKHETSLKLLEYYEKVHGVPF